VVYIGKLPLIMMVASIVVGIALIFIGESKFGDDPPYFVILVITAVTIFIVVILLVTTVGKKTDAKLDYDGLVIRGAMHNTKTQYGDIASIEMRDQMDFGIRLGGYGGLKRIGGKFRNKEFGTYDASLKMPVKKYIIVKKRDERILVFNLETEAETVQFYESLQKRTGRTRE
jgi:hypothetical protein